MKSALYFRAPSPRTRIGCGTIAQSAAPAGRIYGGYARQNEAPRNGVGYYRVSGGANPIYRQSL